MFLTYVRACAVDAELDFRTQGSELLGDQWRHNGCVTFNAIHDGSLSPPLQRERIGVALD